MKHHIMRTFAQGILCASAVSSWSKPALALCDNSGLFGLCSNQDQASQWLDYLFYAKNITDNSGYPIPQGTMIQSALQHALSIYSGAVLVLAGMILLYHLLGMVAETAHTGKPMGRANQIYAPIRLVLAIGLLVPMAGGLNVGQNMMVHVAKWGSNLASHVWSAFLDDLVNAAPPILPPSVPPVVNKVVRDLVMMRACYYAYNAELDILYGGQAWTKRFYTVSFEQTERGGMFTSINEKAVCGSYELPTPNNSAQQVAMVSNLFSINKATIENYVRSQALDSLATKITYFLVPNSNTPAPTKEEFDALVNQYWNTLAQQLQQVANSQTMQSTIAQLANDWSADGWVGAGAWFNTIARVQSNVLDANDAALPRSSPPDMMYLAKQDKKTAELSGRPYQLDWSIAAKPFHGVIGDALNKFNDALDGGEQSTNPQPMTAAATGTNDGQASSGNPLLSLFDLVDWLGRKTGIWPDTDGLLFPLKTANPLSELAYLGHNNLSTGLAMIGWGSLGPVGSAAAGAIGSFAASFISSPIFASVALLTGGMAGALIGQFSWLIITLGCGFIFTGVLLSFALPMIPFIRFFFNVMVWLFTVFEAVVAMPLFALAHLNPYGDGVMPSSAKSGYSFMLSIFLRPVLMIFGLMAGLLLFFVAIVFLNKMFLIATAGTGASAGGYGTLAKIIFSIMYATLAYICANTCFKAIGHFPDHALNWMGSRGPQAKDLGDPSTMQSAITAAVDYVGAKGLVKVADMGKSFLENGKAAADMYANKDAAKRKKAIDDKKKADAAAKNGSGSTSSLNPMMSTANNEEKGAYSAYQYGNEAAAAVKAATEAQQTAKDEQTSSNISNAAVSNVDPSINNVTTHNEQTRTDTNIGFSGNDANNPPVPDHGTNIPTNHAEPTQYKNVQIIHNDIKGDNPFLKSSDKNDSKEASHKESAKVPFEDKNIPIISDRGHEE